MAIANKADAKAIFSDKRNIALMAGLARDGYTTQDIARRIGVSDSTLRKEMRENPKIARAINEGKDVADYLVENALLKSALGYTTKDVKVTVLIKNDEIVETRKETTKRMVAPNVNAIQTWLFNRRGDKWKRDGRNALQLDEDTSINITVTRADKAEIEKEREKALKSDTAHVIENAHDAEWEDVLNDTVTIRGATEQEKKERKKELRNKKRKKAQNAQNDLTKIQREEDELAPIDYDYWPEDWDSDEDN